jgi:hypothetical protein
VQVVVQVVFLISLALHLQLQIIQLLLAVVDQVGTQLMVEQVQTQSSMLP